MYFGLHTLGSVYLGTLAFAGSLGAFFRFLYRCPPRASLYPFLRMVTPRRGHVPLLASSNRAVGVIRRVCKIVRRSFLPMSIWISHSVFPCRIAGIQDTSQEKSFQLHRFRVLLFGTSYFWKSSKALFSFRTPNLFPAGGLPIYDFLIS